MVFKLQSQHELQNWTAVKGTGATGDSCWAGFCFPNETSARKV